jgi:hypothetical protein
MDREILSHHIMDYDKIIMQFCLISGICSLQHLNCLCECNIIPLLNALLFAKKNNSYSLLNFNKLLLVGQHEFVFYTNRHSFELNDLFCEIYSESSEKRKLMLNIDNKKSRNQMIKSQSFLQILGHHYSKTW